METPNFDAMEPSELWEFWSKWHVTTKRKAVELVGVRKDAKRVVETLANYACNLAVAKKLRLEGDIDTASIYERCCELCYERLPDDVRW
jgi:hypothetical protein